MDSFLIYNLREDTHSTCLFVEKERKIIFQLRKTKNFICVETAPQPNRPNINKKQVRAPAIQPSTQAIAAGVWLELNNPICGFWQIPQFR